MGWNGGWDEGGEDAGAQAGPAAPAGLAGPTELDLPPAGQGRLDVAGSCQEQVWKKREGVGGRKEGSRALAGWKVLTLVGPDRLSRRHPDGAGTGSIGYTRGFPNWIFKLDILVSEQPSSWRNSAGCCISGPSGYCAYRLL